MLQLVIQSCAGRCSPDTPALATMHHLRTAQGMHQDPAHTPCPTTPFYTSNMLLQADIEHAPPSFAAEICVHRACTPPTGPTASHSHPLPPRSPAPSPLTHSMLMVAA